MRIPRLYLDADLAEGIELNLPVNRAHYLVNVLRLQPGRPLLVFNGKGSEYEANLVEVTKKNTSVRLGRLINIDTESPLATELAIGVSKGDRMDWVMQKSTELGVKTITPLITERSELKLTAERWQKKCFHWQEIIVNACEQCGRNVLPQLNPPGSLAEFLENCTATNRLLLHPSSSSPDREELSDNKSIALLIGPEGGFSNDEVDLAIQEQFKPWVLGPRILRTETAPIAALSVLQFKYGDYRCGKN